MLPRTGRLSLLFWILGLLASRWAAAQETAAPEAKPEKATAAAKAADASKFLRIERNADDEPISLQTSIVHYVPAKPTDGAATVDLIGAVHVGEKAYYDALNTAFEKYDVVLYELVAPPGTRVPKGGKSSNHPVAALQNGLKGILDLEHQLEHVDYNKDNLVHADMSPDDLSKSMQDRGESFWTLFFRMMGQGIAQQADQQAKGKSMDGELLLALFDKNRAVRLKRIMAEQFENLGGTMQALEGPNGSAIITERNKVALEGLAKQIAAGKKHVAIFYGAGHMNDMEKRLEKDFGLKRDSEQWLTAWNLAAKDAGKKPKSDPAQK